MFDHQVVKTMKNFELSFCMSNLENSLPKNMMLKGLTNITATDLWLLKIYSTIFLNEFLVRFLLQNLVYLRLISKSPQHYRKSRLQWAPLYKILNRKIIIIHFKIGFLKLKVDFKNIFQKYKLLK